MLAVELEQADIAALVTLPSEAAREMGPIGAISHDGIKDRGGVLPNELRVPVPITIWDDLRDVIVAVKRYEHRPNVADDVLVIFFAEIGDLARRHGEGLLPRGNHDVQGFHLCFWRGRLRQAV